MFEFEQFTPFIWSAYAVTGIVFLGLFIWARRKGPKA